ncbi:MAG: geranyl transferase [Betaproteobacteria bacterium]|nr:geranyl transferase [Betaproteobacteria bacterium]
MRDRQARIEAVLEAAMPPPGLAPERLHEAMRYAVLGGGKRVRPLLAYAAGEAAGASDERVDRVAAAVELVHVYSLVHDDLPCMDNDVLRRGKPTVHVQYDEETALLVGDALQSLAFECLTARDLADDPAVQVRMTGKLAQAAGSRGMAGGQAVDLASQGRTLTVAELEFMHIHKTGALISAAITLGAACGRLADAETRGVAHFAHFIGLAFQVVDDVLDATASTEILGKTAGKDAAGQKPTYVSVLGIERSRAYSRELLADALSGLEPLGARGGRLADLGRFIVDRNF